MIGWSIEAARESGCFEHIVVSTDDAEIAEFAEHSGVEVIHRPAELADDHATTAAVVVHSIENFSPASRPETSICCLYATAPFVRPDDIRIGADMLATAEFAFPVTTYPFPIQRAVRLTEANRVAMFDPSNYATRSQDLEEAWHDAGQFYWGSADAWKAPVTFQGAAPIRLPRWRVVDIDTEEDYSKLI